MQIREIMSTDVHLVDPNMTIAECARRMRDDDIGAFPVGENDRLVGMVTDRDLAVRAVAENCAPDSTKVREVMSEGICYCYDDAEVEEAAKVMADHQVRRVPVVNRDKRLCGVVSVADLAKAGVEDVHLQAYRTIARPSGQERLM
ncbi:CBS domain-containing protein [Caenispirillum bisanense]|uniref:CBS domain-containing protein n=1 Tax=Caenispirillum bisanense TaxID=414052 RepID=UPI0031D91B8C